MHFSYLQFTNKLKYDEETSVIIQMDFSPGWLANSHTKADLVFSLLVYLETGLWKSINAQILYSMRSFEVKIRQSREGKHIQRREPETSNNL